MTIKCKICDKEIKDKHILANLNNEHFHEDCYYKSQDGKEELKCFKKASELFY